MAGPRGFIATSLTLIGLEVVLTSDARAFENVKSLLGVPGSLAEAYLSPSVPTFGDRVYNGQPGSSPTGGSRPVSDRPGFGTGTGTAQLTPGMFNVVPLPSSVPAPQVAPAPKR